MNPYNERRTALRKTPRRWLVTGAAGFIGSNLVSALLELDQHVLGLDNFVTGHRHNLDAIRLGAGGRAANFEFVEADICDLDACRRACEGIDFVLHQAALGSVPWSVADPLESNRTNVDGFLNMLVAARDAGVKRMVYASSSAVYGDDPAESKVEAQTGRLLSPYAASKAIDECYGQAFYCTYGFESIGLRYFNVFGPRQDPNGAYAAVIPRWIAELLEGKACTIYGDGLTSRDFCLVDNVVQANILSALAPKAALTPGVFNVAVGERTTLNGLYGAIRSSLAKTTPEVGTLEPLYEGFRLGDIRHSLADISAAKASLGYSPTTDLQADLDSVIGWYIADYESRPHRPHPPLPSGRRGE
ncbi:MAG: LPS biosynthesis protein WbpP [Deltaproteobacteria bacterium CG2_30_63_29]|nr:MAG: LPS biosynthesis protein WbpP [Deltaproteobacteria bacterium CG2_30_63_29]PIV99722.1 MAG: LPS biosynthesis protein WbpP [Deltaproteobacteria bacterium CG17_big_fil_post_rev_8_21_14_2_50_63_7]PJB38275.1 MAG: LPS biosynthesis protein WbpP [Deltaproteobacteria bacterium CG_4_9_14_3_um_filter_63_12]